MSKRKLPEINKKIFPYDLVIAWWEDIVADSIWLDIPDIKKSTTGICHKKGSQYYKQTKNYITYNTIMDCLDSGGRLPR